METITSAIVISSYFTILYELVFMHVPSVASSVNLWSANENYTPELRKSEIRTHSWSLPKKIVILGLPLIIIIATFLYPLYCILMFQEGQSSLIWMILVGIFLILVGRIITIKSVLTIRKNNDQEGDSFQLQKGGLFNKSRNPIQVGMYIFTVGLILIYPSIIFFLGLVFYIFYMHYKILIEEKFLEQKFGDTYKHYVTQTERYI